MKGLMGNYNLQTEDDLIPKGSSSLIPLDSSKEDIFSFGNTCMITYNCDRIGQKRALKNKNIEVSKQHSKCIGMNY